MKRIGLHVLTALAMLLCARPLHAAETVAVLLSERAGAYAELADALRRELGDAAELRSHALSEVDTLIASRPRVAVAVGTQACASLAANAALSTASTGVLCTLVPRSSFERIAETSGERGKALAAIVLDQPIPRQLNLLRAAFPERRHVAALLGPESAALGGALAAAAAQQGLRLSTARVASSDDIHEGLQRVLAEGEVLLALPDSAVFNASTIQNILRTALQRRAPLVAFSPAYVRAGAVLALYSTPEQLGAQAGQAVRARLAGRALARVLPPRQFQVSINPHVARALGLRLPEEAALAERLRQSEEPQ